jgi:hypothetical protein
MVRTSVEIAICGETLLLNACELLPVLAPTAAANS